MCHNEGGTGNGAKSTQFPGVPRTRRGRARSRAALAVLRQLAFEEVGVDGGVHAVAAPGVRGVPVALVGQQGCRVELRGERPRNLVNPEVYRKELTTGKS